MIYKRSNRNDILYYDNYKYNTEKDKLGMRMFSAMLELKHSVTLTVISGCCSPFEQLVLLLLSRNLE